MNIVLCGPFFPDVKDYLCRALRDQFNFNVLVWREQGDPIPKKIDVLVPMMQKINAALMDQLSPRLIQQWGSGLEGVDLDHARKSGIAVANVAATGGNADSVAEHGILLILSLLRKLNVAQANVRTGQLGTPVGSPLAGRTVCLYGLGAIALPLSRMLKAFGVRLLGLTRDPSALKVSDYGLDECYSLSNRELCLSKTDILVVCLRQGQDNANTIGFQELRALPNGALVINLARGGLIEYQALIDCLSDGHLAGAGLDVFWQEPIDTEDPILALPNVVMTPHVAGITTSSMEAIASGVAENIVRLHQGLSLNDRLA